MNTEKTSTNTTDIIYGIDNVVNTLLELICRCMCRSYQA